MTRSRPVLALVLLACILTSMFAVPPPVHATGIPVVDIVNWIENALQVIQQYLEIIQRYEVLYRQYLQYYTMLKNLENYRIDNWRDLIGMYYSIDNLMHQAYTLGYTTAHLSQVMKGVFPGYTIPTNAFLELADRTKWTLTTMGALADNIHRMAENNQPSQFELQAIQEHSNDADGALEALKVSHQIEVHNSTELGKILQAQLSTANAIAVGTSYDVNKDAAATAALEQFLGPAPPPLAPPSDPQFKTYSGVPSNWPWPCPGCSG